MATTGTTTAGPLTEIQIGWGEDTKCTGCFTDLPATCTAYEDGDSLLCVDCAEAELSLRDGDGAITAAERLQIQAAIRAAVTLAGDEAHSENPWDDDAPDLAAICGQKVREAAAKRNAS